MKNRGDHHSKTDIAAPDNGPEPAADSTTRVIGIVNEGTAAWEALALRVICSLSFGYVIAEAMILAPIESVCGKINMTSNI